MNSDDLNGFLTGRPRGFLEQYYLSVRQDTTDADNTHGVAVLALEAETVFFLGGIERRWMMC